VELTVDVVGGHHLTDEGRSLAPVLQALYGWGVARAARTGVTFWSGHRPRLTGDKPHR
jgi:hypothetical protein